MSTVTYEAIRKWCRRFGPEYTRGRLRRRRGRLGDTWHLDEVIRHDPGSPAVSCGAPWMRPVTSSTSSCNRDRNRRRRGALLSQVTERTSGTYPSTPDYRQAAQLLGRLSRGDAIGVPRAPIGTRITARRSPINRSRQRERQMQRFTSAAQLQRFASVHGIVQNLFRVGRTFAASRRITACSAPARSLNGRR